MYTFITLLIVLVSVLLILLVLIQKPKGGGLAQGFSSTNQIMGVKRTSDVVERGTWILSLSLLTLALLINLWIPRGDEVEQGAATRLEEKVLEAPSTPAPTTAPNGSAASGTQNAPAKTGDTAQ
ncbi:MAG: preprotein translocase subunit SecG [Cytophagia bacterium]|nr:preprotein translocase subunit SecG [Cytophagia bacterium]